MAEPLIYELSSPGRRAVTLPAPDVPLASLPVELVRDELRLPEVSQIDVVRHYTRLSQLNHAIDIGFYPLGSCTMKFNPKINEETARLPGFARIHPLQDERTVQGALRLMYDLQDYLGKISGFDAVSLQPAAGAHGEYTGIMAIRAYHLSRGDTRRTKVIVPDSAHGTNPATATMCGYKVVTVRSDERGNVNLEQLRRLADDETAAMMITNPNTLGLFDEGMTEIVEIIHGCGALLYNDGANFNSILGIVRPGDLGVDVMHFNLHKTFSTPHGGGGPGSGPVGVKAHLADFLPTPRVARVEEDGQAVYRFIAPPGTFGKIHTFYGNFGMHVRAYTYIRVNGPDGLRRISEDAVLAANYLKARLQDAFLVPFDRPCMHEFVINGTPQRQRGVSTMDMAKRLMDFRLHPPTVYFPLVVPECMLIEPTETESIETLDAFVQAMLQIAREVDDDPDVIHSAPHVTPVSRLDEARAARTPDLRWAPAEAVPVAD
ncbi:MAG: aminomethyl-transferring glycine dehydrogenase subunit GcvPB [Chloroflexi bacterium]|nr:aminomethyl-transferring glycine dehydrogenase subunit GcvPB [Chloroflexota bacterium]